MYPIDMSTIIPIILSMSILTVLNIPVVFFIVRKLDIDNLALKHEASKRITFAAANVLLLLVMLSSLHMLTYMDASPVVGDFVSSRYLLVVTHLMEADTAQFAGQFVVVMFCAAVSMFLVWQVMLDIKKAQ